MTARRDPGNELYDRACDLLEAARELHLVAACDGNDDAMAATLGCMEAALGELAETHRVLHQIAGGGRHLADAVVALDRARAATDAARAARARTPWLLPSPLPR